MPEMNGWQLADEVNELKDKSIQIVVVSGWGEELTDNEMKSHHVKKVLSKPVDLKTLKNLLSEISNSVKK